MVSLFDAGSAARLRDDGIARPARMTMIDEKFMGEEYGTEVTDQRSAVRRQGELSTLKGFNSSIEFE